MGAIIFQKCQVVHHAAMRLEDLVFSLAHFGIGLLLVRTCRLVGQPGLVLDPGLLCLYLVVQFIELGLGLFDLGVLGSESRAQVGIGCCRNCTGVTQVSKQTVGCTSGVPLG